MAGGRSRKEKRKESCSSSFFLSHSRKPKRHSVVQVLKAKRFSSPFPFSLFLLLCLFVSFFYE